MNKKNGLLLVLIASTQLYSAQPEEKQSNWSAKMQEIEKSEHYAQYMAHYKKKIEEGWKINEIIEGDGRTPLIRALSFSTQYYPAALLALNADVNKPDKNKTLPLQAALNYFRVRRDRQQESEGRIAVIKKMLDARADVAAALPEDNDFMSAVVAECGPVVQLMLQDARAQKDKP